MSEIEKQAESLYQEIANAKVGTIPAEVIGEWKKLGELLYHQSRPTKRAADKANASDVCIACQREHNKNHIGLR